MTTLHTQELIYFTKNVCSSDQEKKTIMLFSNLLELSSKKFPKSLKCEKL